VPAALQVSNVPQDSVALIAPAAPDPTKGLVEQQRQAWLEQLSTDRKLEYLRHQRLRSAQKAEMENPREVVVPADDLDPDKVRAVFDLTTQDPAELIAVQRVRRVQESFAVRLEHLLTCDVPESLRGVGVRITSVDFPEWSPTPHVVPLDLVIRFAPLRGQNGDQLQRRLDKAVPELSKELARRLNVRLLLGLRFVLDSDEENAISSTQSTLWRTAKRQRQIKVRRAMNSWSDEMEWRPDTRREATLD